MINMSSFSILPAPRYPIFTSKSLPVDAKLIIFWAIRLAFDHRSNFHSFASLITDSQQRAGAKIKSVLWVLLKFLAKWNATAPFLCFLLIR